MVVIKEFFPSQKEFIADYMDKRRQRLEILQQRNFKLSFVPREEEILTPFETLQATGTDSIERSAVSTDIGTPKIIPLTDEPVYVKNFKKFITETQLHLDQVLANNRKIDAVHGIVNDILTPALELNRFDVGTINTACDSGSISGASSNNTLGEKSVADLNISDSEKLSSSTISPKNLKSGKAGRRLSKISRAEIDSKVNSCRSRSDTKLKSFRLGNDPKDRKADGRLSVREDLQKTRKIFKTHSFEFSKEKDPEPKPPLSSTERLRRFQNIIANRTPLSTRSARASTQAFSNKAPQSTRTSSFNCDDTFDLNNLTDLKEGAGKNNSSHGIVPHGNAAKKMFRIPVSIINL